MNNSKLMDIEGIDKNLSRIVIEIIERNKSVDTLAVIGIKTRGEFIGKRIVEKLSDFGNKKIPFGTLDITLYRDDLSNKSNWPKLKQSEIPFSVDGLDVLLVDDVVFTGRSIRAAIDAVMDYGRPSSIQLAALVDRGHRELPIQPDYLGLKIETKSDEQVKVYLNEVDGKEEVVIISQ